MNFISKNLPESDKALFFKGEDEFHVFDPATGFSLADIAVTIGFFPSKGQATKNGWSRDPLPSGFGMKKAGKKGIVAWLNDFEDNEP